MKIAIAVDIGASGGRLIAGWVEDGRLQTKEQHRFPNGMVKRDGHLYWDIDGLYNEILAGLYKAGDFASVGACTWGVDYALLDESGELVAPVYAYRDDRTAGFIDTVDKERVYALSGIQIASFNTLYQLMAHTPKKAAHFLTVPDYLHYRLCGRIACEYTIATTTQLVSTDGDWNDELIAMTGFDRNIFPEIVRPGTVLGRFNDNAVVIAPACHDTGSAVAAVPASGTDFAYISSGTWSLMGIESKTPRMDSRFTNEGGVCGTYRTLKNIVGLWILQETRRLLPESYDYPTLERLAETPFGSVVDVNDSRFMNPSDMILELQAACRETGQRVPTEAGELARCIFDSLAQSYKQTYDELSEFADINRIHIIGGGSQNKLLNRLCAETTGCEVVTGPVEATATGNLLVQLIALGEIKDLSEGRRMVAESLR